MLLWTALVESHQSFADLVGDGWVGPFGVGECV